VRARVAGRHSEYAVSVRRSPLIARSALALALASATACGAQSAKEAATGTSGSHGPAGAPGAHAGRADYDAAREAAAGDDLVQTIAGLERAVAADPDFAEAWYELGVAREHRAAALVDDDEPAAVHLFREAVVARKRARALFLLDKAALWSGSDL